MQTRRLRDSDPTRSIRKEDFIPEERGGWWQSFIRPCTHPLGPCLPGWARVLRMCATSAWRLYNTCKVQLPLRFLENWKRTPCIPESFILRKRSVHVYARHDQTILCSVHVNSGFGMLRPTKALIRSEKFAHVK